MYHSDAHMAMQRLRTGCTVAAYWLNSGHTLATRRLSHYVNRCTATCAVNYAVTYAVTYTVSYAVNCAVTYAVTYSVTYAVTYAGVMQ